MAQNLRKPKILLIEDCGTIPSFLADQLTKYGDVDTVDNGQIALVKVGLERFDAVITDVNMPLMDGIEFFKLAIEADPGIKNRFLFYTSSITTEYINFFIDNDVPFLFKPAQNEDIESMMEELLYHIPQYDQAGHA